MPSQDKIEWVEELEETVRDAPDMVFTNFKGLTVEELEDLRVELYEHDASYRVVKNRLAHRAFRQALGNGDGEEGSDEVEEEPDSTSSSVEADLDDLPGIGPAKVESLEEAGVETVSDVVEASPEELTDVKGIGEAKARSMKEGAEELVETSSESDTSADTDETAATDDDVDGVADDLEEFLVGNTGVAFSGDGFVNTAKVITEFSEEHDKLTIKGGLLEGSILDEESVEDISELPTRDELLTQLASSVNSPIQALASFLNYPIQSLVNSLEQIKDQKEE